MNLKVNKTITITTAELIELLEQRVLGEKIESLDFEYKSSGDYDRGNYKEELTSITLTIKP